MPDLVPFEYEGRQFRGTTVNGAPWFIARDTCGVLDLRNVGQALSYLDEDEKGVITSDTPGGDQRVSIISESGLYSLILRSRKPEAKKFKRWITHEVLPAIRRTGRYEAPGAEVELQQQVPRTLSEALRMAADNLDRAEVAEARVAELEPKAETLDALKDLEGSLYVRQVAHIFDIGPQKFFDILYAEKILQRGDRRPYSEHRKWFRTIFDSIELPDGSEKATCTTFVRPEGVGWLYRKLTEKGYQLRRPEGEMELRLPDDTHRTPPRPRRAIEQGNVRQLPPRNGPGTGADTPPGA